MAPEPEGETSGSEAVEVVTEEVIMEVEQPAVAAGHSPEDAERRSAEEADKEFKTPGILKVVYALFSPLLVPSYVSLIIFLLSLLAIMAPGAAVPYTLTIFGATCVVPFLTIYVLMKVDAVHNFEIYDARARVVPYIIEFLALGGVTLFLIYKGANSWIWTIYCGATAVALVNFLLNFKIRISNHCSAMGALVAALIVVNRFGYPPASLFWWVIGAVFFAGLVGTVAMTHGRHTVWEVLAGYAMGFLGIILFSMIR